MESVRSNISSNGRRNPYKTITLPKLWLQYTDMIDILRKFIKAERTGHWLQHLEALSEMLLYMIASGHNLYTKSAQLCCIVSCCVPESRGWIPHSMKKWPKMGGAIRRPCCRAGVNAKHEDEWWLNKRKRDDRGTVASRTPFDASLCWDELYHAGSHRGLLQYQRT